MIKWSKFGLITYPMDVEFLDADGYYKDKIARQKKSILRKLNL